MQRKMGATKDNLHPIIGYEGSASYGHPVLVATSPYPTLPHKEQPAPDLTCLKDILAPP